MGSPGSMRRRQYRTAAVIACVNAMGSPAKAAAAAAPEVRCSTVDPPNAHPNPAPTRHTRANVVPILFAVCRNCMTLTNSKTAARTAHSNGYFFFFDAALVDFLPRFGAGL